MIIRRKNLPDPPEQHWGWLIDYPIDRVHAPLDHFHRNRSKPGTVAADHIHQTEEEFWYIVDGTGTLVEGGQSYSVGPRDLIIHMPGVRHALHADAGEINWFCFSFNRYLSDLVREPLRQGTGEPISPDIEGSPFLIRGGDLPPQEGNACVRYPHDRPHSALDHWDANSTAPGDSAANHTHQDHWEYWYILDGDGLVYHDGEPFDVSSGDLIVHAPGVHHKLVAGDRPVTWFCFAMNRWLVPYTKDALEKGVGPEQ